MNINFIYLINWMFSVQSNLGKNNNFLLGRIQTRGKSSTEKNFGGETFIESALAESVMRDWDYKCIVSLKSSYIELLSLAWIRK